MYALRVIGKSDTKRIKGVKKNVVAKTITFDDYARCLNDVTIQSRRQSCIRSTLHEVYTVSELKLALSPCDDKRYVIPNRSLLYLGDIIKYLCNVCVCCIFYCNK